jgi:Kef-type K+ transport system membrane component KefB/nucleotide-binding universal stress UspA family protein
MHISGIVQVLIQVVVIIGVSRLVGLGFRRINQPLVIGEIVAGIMLGPSLLGAVAPAFSAALFPPQTLPLLEILKDLGLIFFMFLIGLELDPKYLKGGLKTAVLVSHTSIVTPFSLGLLLAMLLYPLVSQQGVSFTAFSLFLGAAMSITAFPVLARILTEKNLQNTPIGTLALTCAAVDDVTAWCLLALAISVAGTNSMAAALPVILLSLLYVGGMVLLGRPLLAQIAKFFSSSGKLDQSLLALIYVCVILSSVMTELIGIHFIFGAFLVGALMPKQADLTRVIAEKTEDFVLVVLLPLFFAYSGLKTQIGLLNQPILWALCGLVLLVAIVGKYCGTFLAARLSGLNRQDASALGWLMNTRGLTELIVLNIGLSLGVITPLLFTMLVIMALVTTFMTSPLLAWTYPKGDRLALSQPPPIAQDKKANPPYRVLVPMANPKSQQPLLTMAGAIAGEVAPAMLLPLSLVQLENDYYFESMPLEADRRLKVRREQIERLLSAQMMAADAFPATAIEPIVQVSQDVARTTADLAVQKQANLILLGWHRPVFSNSRLGGRVAQILNNAPVDVAVYIDRADARPVRQILLLDNPSHHTALGLDLALRLLLNDPQRELSLLRLKSTALSRHAIDRLAKLPEEVRSRIATPIIHTSKPMETLIHATSTADLTIVGMSQSWGRTGQAPSMGHAPEVLAFRCESSLLITRSAEAGIEHLGGLI